MKERRRSGERGSVLMEYVVLCAGVGAVLVLFWHMELYNHTEGWRDGKLKLGRSTVNFYQRVLGSIAMPVP